MRYTSRKLFVFLFLVILHASFYYFAKSEAVQIIILLSNVFLGVAYIGGNIWQKSIQLGQSYFERKK